MWDKCTAKSGSNPCFKVFFYLINNLTLIYYQFYVQNNMERIAEHNVQSFLFQSATILLMEKRNFKIKIKKQMIWSIIIIVCDLSDEMKGMKLISCLIFHRSMWRCWLWETWNMCHCRKQRKMLTQVQMWSWLCRQRLQNM